MPALEKKMILKEPLARVKGHGSAKEGVMHWIAQRLTSIALIPLMIWFVVSLLMRLHENYHGFVAWIASPLTSVLLTLLVVTLFYHMWLGLKVVIEDYVLTPMKRYTTLILLKFSLFFLATLSIFTILKIALGA
jgi:succinate dehydrogenase / fumarate reductase, membrane anchor subunit